MHGAGWGEGYWDVNSQPRPGSKGAALVGPDPGPFPPSPIAGPIGVNGPTGPSGPRQEPAGLNGPTGPTSANPELLDGRAHGVGVAGVVRAGVGEFKLTGGDAEFTLSRAPRTVIGRTVLSNQIAVRAAAISLLATLDLKLETSRIERTNDVSEFEDLRRLIEVFLAAMADSDETPIVEATTSIAKGFRHYWDQEHVSICGKAVNTALFAAGLSFCAVAGALGIDTASIVTVGALVGGKNVADALKAYAQSLPGKD